MTEETGDDTLVAELFALWCLGDNAALEQLLALQERWLQGFLGEQVRGVLERFGTPEDYRQELMLRLLRSGPPRSLSSAEQLHAYLEAAARNLLTDKLREASAAKRRLGQEQFQSDLQIDPDEVDAQQSGPGTRADRLAAVSWLRSALNNLAAEDREVILSRAWDEQPFAEIGARLGITEDASRMRFSRALRKLAREVARVRRE